MMAGLTGYLHAGIVDGKADLVLGQANFTSGSANRGGSSPAANTLNGPLDVYIDTMTLRVYVADYGNHRVLWWSNYNTLVNGESADGVLGQANFTSGLYNRTGSTATCAANTLYYPARVTVDSGRNVWVSDRNNSRVLKYNYSTLANGVNASMVIGQANFTSNLANRGGSPTAQTLSYPWSVSFDYLGNLWVGDGSNNRLLKYLRQNIATNCSASYVEGQANLTIRAQNDSNGDGVTDSVSAKTLYNPFYAAPYSIYMSVVDYANNRVLRYSGVVSSNLSFASADRVFGQLNFTSNYPNQSAGRVVPNSTTLNKPWGMTFENSGNVWIADTANHRVLKYNSAGMLTAGTPASLVLGQGDFVTGNANRAGTVNSNTLYNPASVVSDYYGNIWVADYTNHRVLRYDALRLTNVSPSTAYNFDTISVNIFGKGLPAGSTVALTMNGQNPIHPSSVNVLTSSSAICTFKLNNAAVGSWKIVVTSTIYIFNGSSEDGFYLGSSVTCNSFSSQIGSAITVTGFGVTGVSRSEVFSTGTVSMSVSGAGFPGGCGVSMYNPLVAGSTITATSVNVVSSGLITFNINLSSGITPGYWTVAVTSGSYRTELRGAVYVKRLWNISSITPGYGYATGSVGISNLAGENFLAGSQVRLSKAGEADIDATNVNVVSSSKITCDIDLTGKAIGMWDVVITSGALSNTAAGVFEIKVGGWSVGAITPSSAYNYGVVEITDLSGANFPAGAGIKLSKSGESDIVGTDVTMPSGTKMACNLDLTLKATGYWDVVVTSDVYSAQLSGGFEIKGMELRGITPSASYSGVVVDITGIEGQGFLGGSVVSLRKSGESDIVAGDVVVTGTKITCKFNLSGAAVGLWDVVVTSGIFGATLAGGFEVRYDVSASALIDDASEASLMFRGEKGDTVLDLAAGTFASDVTLNVSTAVVPGSDDETIVPTKTGVNITNDKALQPRKDFSLTMYYRDIDTMNYDATKFVIGYYDEANIRWVVLPSQVNVTSKRVVARPNHLTIFAILQLAPSTNVDNARIFPNPYNPRKHTQGMTIANLPARAELKIYTVGGDLVREVGYTTGNSRTVWDGKNDAGLEVASGVYVMLIKSPIGTTKIKFAVER